MIAPMTLSDDAPGIRDLPAISDDTLAALRSAWTPRPEADTPGRAALVRLAEATRALIEAVQTVDPNAAADLIESVADDASDLAARIAALPRMTRGTTASRDIQPHQRSPLSGAVNPLAPPLEFSADGPLVRAHAVFGSAYEGPPGRVHGGFVAAAFDEVLGVAQSGSGSFGFTGRLTVHLRRATPLHERIDYEGGVERVDGRKSWVTARSYCGGVLVADAEGLFIRASAAP